MLLVNRAETPMNNAGGGGPYRTTVDFIKLSACGGEKP